MIKKHTYRDIITAMRVIIAVFVTNIQYLPMGDVTNVQLFGENVSLNEIEEN